MAGDSSDLDAIGAAFASAALDPSRWDDAMDTAAGATGCVGAILLPLKGRLTAFPFSREMHGIAEDYVGNGWMHRDERYKSIPFILSRGVATEFDFTSPEEMARSPFYQEHIAAHGLRWFAGVKVGDGEDVWGLSLQRSEAQGPFQASEIERLASLSRSLAGIPRLARAFGSARMEAALLGFEASGSPAIIVDHAGGAVGVNDSAERLFGPDLNVVQRRIVSGSREATDALNRALRDLLSRSDGPSTQPPVALPRRSGPPILAYPFRLPVSASDVFSPGRACVVFADLGDKRSAPAEDLVAVFGLTPAEARLAVQIVAAGTLEEAAGSLGIAYETARTLLKSVFRKTDTNRQAQLAALLGRMRRASIKTF